MEPTPDVKATTTIEAPGAPTAQTTSTTNLKPGLKTTELWFAKIVAIIGALMATGYIADGTQTARICGAIMVAAAALGYPISRGLAKGGAALLLIVVTMSSSTACSHSTRNARLRDAVTGLNVASAALVAYDKEHQAQIVEHATSLADGTAALEAYKARRSEVVDHFVAAYRAIATAALLDSTTPALAKAVAAVDLALQAWASLKGGAP